MDSDHFNPLALIRGLTKSRYLLAQLIKRDVALRYRGAMFGVLWAFLNPLIMLVIFAFVFGSVFQPHWPPQSEGLPFWLILYDGLIVFNVFAESVSRSPNSVRDYPSFVKKIIFPVLILPVVPLGTALVHGVFSLLIFIAALFWTGHISIDILLFPLLLAPVVLLALGLSWFLAAWGVFIKDIAQVVPLLVQVSLFLSPVFYPVSAVPHTLRAFYQYNPIGAVIEASRAIATGSAIQWYTWAVTLLIGFVAAILGHAFFQHSREEFADVL